MEGFFHARIVFFLLTTFTAVAIDLINVDLILSLVPADDIYGESMSTKFVGCVLFASKLDYDHKIGRLTGITCVFQL